jgi:hypothetical protein
MILPAIRIVKQENEVMKVAAHFPTVPPMHAVNTLNLFEPARVDHWRAEPRRNGSRPRKWRFERARFDGFNLS